MGILSDTIIVIKKELDLKEIELSLEIQEKIEKYIIKKPNNKGEGLEIMKSIIDAIISNNKTQIEVLNAANKTQKIINKEIDEIKALLRTERKPFEKDRKKYYYRYNMFLLFSVSGLSFLMFLLVLPALKDDWLEWEFSFQIIYRISILIPFSTIITLLIYQFHNALKHYHKACEAIHIMKSYPAIIKIISPNKEQKNKATKRLFEVLFDWHPRPRNWHIKKDKTQFNDTIKKLNKLMSAK